MDFPEKNCCTQKSKGLFSGVLLGILPHSFCIAFAFFSAVGAAAASAFFKKFLLIPNFFVFMIIISLILATASSAIYLKNKRCLCMAGVKNKWRYIFSLYFVMISVNLLMFLIILPALANLNFQKTSSENANAEKILGQDSNLSEMTISVQLPCSGHAPLIIDEIKKNCNVRSVTFSSPNIFYIKYDLRETTPEKIASLEIFKTFEATKIKNGKKVD